MSKVSFEIPDDVLARLTEAWGDVARASRESLAIESYRAGKISLGTLAALCGFSGTVEALGWLAGRGVQINYGQAELDADRATIAELFDLGR